MNTARVSIDPGLFAGRYHVGTYGDISPSGTGPRNIAVVRGVQGYPLYATEFGFCFTFGVDADGSPAPSSVTCAVGSNTFTFDLTAQRRRRRQRRSRKRLPNNGDGNGDGIPDSRQGNVASLPNAVDGEYLTLASENGTILSELTTTENPSPGDVPPYTEFPFGFLGFSIGQLTVRAATTATLYPPPHSTFDTYYKYGRTPDSPETHWYEFLYNGTTGAELLDDDADGYTDRILLHFVDGERGDDDLTANGVVRDPGALALKLNEPPVALAGGPYDVIEGGSVELNASGTTDANQDAATLLYEWDFDGDGNFGETNTAHGNENGLYPTFIAGDLDGPDWVNVSLRVTDDGGLSNTTTTTIAVVNVAPTVEDLSLSAPEHTPNGTVVGSISATDPGSDTATYRIVGGNGAGAFQIDPSTGEISVGDASLLDYETVRTWTLQVQATDDDQGDSNTAIVTINLENQPSISGSVFVDIDGDGLYDANEPAVDTALIELLDADGHLLASTTTGGGFYLFEDLDPGTYLIREVQPTGVADGAELLGTLDGTIVANDVMRITLERTDAHDYCFAELGQQITSGDAASIGFWQNKHGQELINAGGAALANWLSGTFSHVFGSVFDSTSVADFYRDELFKQKSTKSAGPAKVDAQFMAVALATYFTSNHLAGNVAAAYGFNVTDTGIGTKIVNVGSRGAAFGTTNGANLTVMQLLQGTNELTDQPDEILGAAKIYDINGDGVIDTYEASLRVMANDLYSAINDGGGI